MDRFGVRVPAKPMRASAISREGCTKALVMAGLILLEARLGDSDETA